MRILEQRGSTLQRLGLMYNGAILLQCLSITLVAIHDLLDRLNAGDSDLLLILALGLQVTVVASLLGFRTILMANRDYEEHMRADSEAARRRTAELFAMTDMLQAAETNEEAGAVLMVTARRLLGGYGAALYVLNNSRDRLDLARHWDLPAGYIAPDSLAANHCWALKRGKAHVNAPEEGGLCCAHHGGVNAVLEIPMMAGGQVQGLLILARSDALIQLDGGEELANLRHLGSALADSMSLALSNIALRDRLRTQSLRDPLTGLYNRRYMEDTLERFLALSTRSGSSTAVIMIDLDNFKDLNDRYGHAKGDAVLRDVAAQIVGALRPTDVVCRYGGEEIIAILPDCALADAVAKAEQIRLRIQGVTDIQGCPVSASLGVSAMPETSVRGEELVPDADASLYLAKASGKNCVFAAERITSGLTVARVSDKS
ncbi:GGDEF domain-containing protein [Novosphingobium sp. SG720]|uniref:sensor domain-containing diguanylate cyclase n=1 Tax=Novosphingobium sp. SG720 TaxID=2586998 RepID=UPI001447F47D|nr:GGDEF domain-containing protein [Novosphingobium sp. SG720]NKJ43359.1 diguanylate cyclase [Novosphingobium sp. SG720]